jgi:hypothetical protein
VSEPPDLRVSDADRERVAERLRDAAGEGRLTIEELDERVERAYGSRTGAELAELTADLPGHGRPGVALGPPSERKPRRWVISLMGGSNLRGRWRAAPRMRSIAVMGGSDIDLRHAELDAGEVTITAFALMGGVDVIVPVGTDVELTGFAIMGGNDNKVPHHDLPPDAPRVHVRAFSLMGGVDVRLGRRDRKALQEHPPSPPLPR